MAFTRAALHRVYPRTCGGTEVVAFAACGYKGLSPHVRGNRDSGVMGCRHRGSIPARAGEPM